MVGYDVCTWSKGRGKTICATHVISQEDAGEKN
jgi:hypothetical protein